jgi:transcription elongation factor Elf1
MSTQTVFTKEQAKASDKVLAELTDAYYRACDLVSSAANSVHRIARDKKLYRPERWAMMDDEALEAAKDRVENEEFNPQRESQLESIARYENAIDAREDARLAHNKQDEEWFQHGQWSRFFLVQDGHIHARTSCQSLRITTRVGWLPELSGESEEDAVKAHGAMLCTFCFPSAPVEWTRGKPADPSTCEGSGIYAGEYMTDKQKRLYSKFGTCPHCGEGVSVTSTMKFRKHKK